MLAFINERKHVISHYKPSYQSLKNDHMLSTIKGPMLSIIKERSHVIKHLRSFNQPLKATISSNNEKEHDIVINH